MTIAHRQATQLNTQQQQTQKQQIFVVVEDHESSLLGIKAELQKRYPEVDILTAQTSQRALEIIRSTSPALVVSDVVLPESTYSKAAAITGVNLLKALLKSYPELRIVIHSAQPLALRRLQGLYEAHQGGFAIAGKNQPVQTFLNLVHSTLEIQGFLSTPPEMRRLRELKEEWQTVLHLAFEEGLRDCAIAKQMNVSERTVKNYIQRLRNAFDIQLTEEQDLRAQLAIRARESGVIA